MSTGLRIVFAGTPEFALPSLKALLASEHEVVAVYTATDKPAGRGRKLTPSPVKKLALEHGVAVKQPENLRSTDAVKELQALRADVMVVVAYGQILPQAILDTPRLACLNVHASLLPQWRGAAPIQRAILAGDTHSGVCIMRMERGLDTGPVLLAQSCTIGAEDTAQNLHDHLAQLGASALISVLASVDSYLTQAKPQDATQSTYAEKLTKAEALIDWQACAVDIHRHIRAFYPWPMAYTFLQQQRIRVHKAKLIAGHSTAKPGTIIAQQRDSVDVATSAGIIRLLCLQLPGSKALPVESILHAQQALFRVGQMFTAHEN